MQSTQPSSGSAVREVPGRDIRAGRYALLLIVVLTAVNLVLLLTDNGQYFLFSASVPYYLTFLALGLDNGFTPLRWSEIGRLTKAALGISVGTLAVYLLFWLLSRKRPGWLLGALVLFVLDTAALVGLSFLLVGKPWMDPMDLFLHIWAIVELGKAVAAHSRSKKAPPKDPGDGTLMNN